MRWLRLTAILLALGPASHALAVQPDEILKDPVQEARARTLSKQLRCMVCQNQSIDDSDAPLARDLRILVRERIQAGDSNSQVLDFLVQRYGEFVLLRPRLHWRTALLWLAPPVLLIGGGLLLFLLARRRRAGSPADAALPQGGALTPDEERRLARLIKPDDR
jgi:cytochrome c-type biogenesis protein CcmH